ncbi:uncharacterized protein N0V89_011680 [Didymosphaeria variabile]|uniref:GPI anchored cell wall protein n=1 Tax=Didymosphaeria variabile TaxID=1932322 RepID=A0A9W8XA68_9PLEO|nr:uncharacterized protein N0V89_011680 [Didymosphaeria variabile]KAJ4345547.1 hypothetical protein N0V89_011680 [Didymosphaeria variabile]
MKGFTFATVAALAATTFAATVTLEQTPCLQPNATSLDQFDVDVDKLTVIDLASVCGLKIVSADGVDKSKVSCQAFKDAEGKETGSAKFTADKNAMIATNPVQEKAILCVSEGDVTSAQPTTFAVVSTTASLAAPTGGASPSGNSTSNPTSPSQPSASSTNPADQGAASTIGMSFGALSAAAIAMLFL